VRWLAELGRAGVGLAGVGLVVIAPGCIGVPFASLGGRGRVAAVGVVGDVTSPRGRPEAAVQAHVGTAILSVTDPGPREWDVELGYALDAFPGHQELDRNGGYAGLHWFPWNGDGARVSVGGDVDLLWGFDQRLALGATLSAGIEAYAGCTGAMGGGDAAYAGLLGFGRGEWGLGIQAHASYRFVDGEHYAMFGASVSLRFPAGIGVGYVTALGAYEASRPTTSTPSPGDPEATRERARPIAPYGFCERPVEYVPLDAPPRRPEPDRWRCEGVSADGAMREDGFVHAPSQDEAIALCRRDFVVAHEDGGRCTCARAP
jgi:hypothetical protein